MGMYWDRDSFAKWMKISKTFHTDNFKCTVNFCHLFYVHISLCIAEKETAEKVIFEPGCDPVQAVIDYANMTSFQARAKATGPKKVHCMVGKSNFWFML